MKNSVMPQSQDSSIIETHCNCKLKDTLIYNVTWTYYLYSI